jgi:hypothetical protein
MTLDLFLRLARACPVSQMDKLDQFRKLLEQQKWDEMKALKLQMPEIQEWVDLLHSELMEYACSHCDDDLVNYVADLWAHLLPD